MLSYKIVKKSSLFEVIFKDLKKIESAVVYPIRKNNQNKDIFFVDVKENSFADTLIKNNCLNFKENGYKYFSTEI